MLATVVDTAELGKTVLAALVAGVGVTASFSLMIFGISRFAEMRRDDRRASATLFATVAVIALLVTVGGIVAGMIVMLSG
ncbi:MAG: hypothetical protein H0V15_01680 [Solirubrobacterales bacterium]|nr:hypothetical protein [Solirubrobacterales bacterium]